MIDTAVEMCHCGKPLHYTDPKTEEYVRMMIARMGTHVDVTVGDRTFSVPRHYIALHGLKGNEVEQLGFREVVAA